jgi:glyoxylase-like metal-dependent hydrolase (beta-lactamase superfamily II)
MGRALLIAGLVLVLILVVGGAYVYRAATGLEVDRVTEDVFMITGLGGNVGVLRTAAGPVVVDSMTFQAQGEGIRARAEELGGGPTQTLINTHYHSDHTHGNPGFVPGLPIVSTERTLEHLRTFDAEFWTEGAEALLPNDTFEDARELSIGGKTIRLYYLGAGHTDGDLVVLFVEDKVLHAGDLVFRKFYPNIDLEAGGSLAAWSKTLDRVLELPFERVIPGHGPVTDRDGIRAYQRFVDQLWLVGQKAAAEGWTLEQTQATDELTEDAGFGVIGIPFVFSLDRPFVLRRAYEEATGAIP